jgi:hypothetical protein
MPTNFRVAHIGASTSTTVAINIKDSTNTAVDVNFFFHSMP